MANIMAVQNVQDLLQDDMIVDCSSISISYAPTGLATISFTVFTLRSGGVPYDTDGPGFEMCIGGVTFNGWINSMELNANSDAADFFEWKVSAVAIGCKKDPCSSGCN